jgi:cysteine desulfurase
VHGAGRAARRALEAARAAVAAGFGARAAGVVFTSGGTEANALAVRGLGAGRRLVIGATEHDAVRAACPGAAVVPVDGHGVAELAALARMLAEGPALVCLMAANNETGVLHPIAEAAALCRAHGALLHVDAVQAAGRMALDIGALGADSMAISGHKLGGPQGAGALILAGDPALAPLLAGGGQERGRRGGTPALPAIAGMAAALATALAEPVDLAALRDAIEAAAVAAGAVVMGAGAPRLGNTTCLALPGVRADTQVIALDLAGFAVSAGAACSSGKVAASHVLAAMGLGDLAGCAVRVSLPWNVAAEDVRRFADAYVEMAGRLRRTGNAA